MFKKIQYPISSIQPNTLAKAMIIAGLVLSVLCLTTAEASVSEDISYSTSITNSFGITIPAGMSVGVSLSASISSTITITGPDGYSNTVNASGPGSSTHEMTLGAAGTYDVSESHSVELTGKGKFYIKNIKTTTTRKLKKYPPRKGELEKQKICR